MSKKPRLPANSDLPAVGLEAAKKAAKANAAKKTIETNDLNNIEENVMNTAKPNFEKITAEAANANKEQLDAFIQSGNLFLKGAENILKAYATLAQSTVEKNSENVKTLLACKTLNELTETQNKLAQESFEGFVTGATTLSELSVKVATESLEPITAQLSKTIKKATDSVAA